MFVIAGVGTVRTLWTIAIQSRGTSSRLGVGREVSRKKISIWSSGRWYWLLISCHGHRRQDKW